MRAVAVGAEAEGTACGGQVRAAALDLEHGRRGVTARRAAATDVTGARAELGGGHGQVAGHGPVVTFAWDVGPGGCEPSRSDWSHGSSHRCPRTRRTGRSSSGSGRSRPWSGRRASARAGKSILWSMPYANTARAPMSRKPVAKLSTRLVATSLVELGSHVLLAVPGRVAQVLEQHDRILGEVDPLAQLVGAVVLGGVGRRALVGVQAEAVLGVLLERAVRARPAVAVAHVHDQARALDGVEHVLPRWRWGGTPCAPACRRPRPDVPWRRASWRFWPVHARTTGRR